MKKHIVINVNFRGNCQIAIGGSLFHSGATEYPGEKMELKKLTTILKNLVNDIISILVLIFNRTVSLTDKKEWHSGALTP